MKPTPNLSLGCAVNRHYACVPKAKDCQCECHLK